MKIEMKIMVKPFKAVVDIHKKSSVKKKTNKYIKHVRMAGDSVFNVCSGCFVCA